jgi:tetratricopeptide (TPR) repeat protein
VDWGYLTCQTAPNDETARDAEWREMPKSVKRRSPRRAVWQLALWRRSAVRAFSFLVVGTVLASGCRSDPPNLDEVFTTRTLALGYLQRGQLPEAEEQFKKLIAMVPDDPLGYADLGLTYLQGERYREAESQLRRARQLDPANPDIGLLVAKLYSLTGRADDARAILDQLSRDTSATARVLYALAELEAQGSDTGSLRRRGELLARVLAVSPANVAVRSELADVLVRRARADSAVQQLEEIRRIPPAPPAEALAPMDSAIRLLQGGRLAEARGPLDRIIELLRVTSPYQASLSEVKGADGPLVGRPVLTFKPTHLITLRRTQEQSTADSVRFVDITDEAGLFDPRTRTGAGGAAPAGAAGPTALAAGDVDGDGTDDLLVSFWSAEQRRSEARLYSVQRGFARDMTERAGVSLPGGAAFATFADVDNDGWLDLFAIDNQGRGQLLRNRGNGTFEDATARARVASVNGAQRALFLDLDHDGDLDLLLYGRGTLRVHRNNLDGTFSEATAGFGLGGIVAATDAAFGDLDSDGRIDLVLADSSGGVRLLRNGGPERFSDVTASSGVGSGPGAGAVAVGDYDSDGDLDLFVARTSGDTPLLWLNNGTGTFTADRRSGNAVQPVRVAAARAAGFVDYDNDGWLDLIVTGTPNAAGQPGVVVLRNVRNGSFSDRSAMVPPPVRARGGTALAVTDVDEDGDEDVLVTDSAGVPRLLRNAGGNNSMAVRVELKGLRTGSGKNNVFGIGARLELRAGEIYQTRVVTGRVTHFGLGSHLKADVLRVEWPNGVPQTVFLPGTDQDVVESEMLKGSCAFAYTWDGTRFRFVTDVMWRSALGMPLGLMGGTTSQFAPAGASQEYLRIPGSVLKPRDGRYVVQITEELWETAYTDEIKLVAVDHPDSVDVFVDERFVPPSPVNLRLFQTIRRRPPVSATDERGNDLLPALLENDDRYVSNLTPMQYQGVVEPHDLILDLGDDAGRPGTHLFLRGWIYPTDASINVALSQQSSVKLAPPSVEVRDAKGNWTTVIPSIGFPSGKDKTIVIDLAGKFPTADHRVRLRTNMQIYWDQAFIAGDAAASPVKVTTLKPVSADLHFRGFSRVYRKGGRYGPYWFAYDDVTKETPWRPIDGAFTRFGDVLELLEAPDDMYVIMGPGDETTVQFDASSARDLPPGWTRDFLLYTDGWIKDSDLNTAHGTTVGPLPFHRIKEYPYAPGESYPTDAEHQRYLREYNTRMSPRR